VLEGSVMANACLPDTFYDLVAHHLPPEKTVGPKGGRPPIPHRIALKVVWFVLMSGCRWEDVPREMGCSGRTAHRRLQLWEELGVWDHLHADLLRLLRQNEQLDPDLVIVDGVIVRAFGGGEFTGPSPVDRRKKGSKHTLLVDRHCIPLAIHTAGANASDPRNTPTRCMPMPATTARRPAGCWRGWGSRRRLTNGVPSTVADWARSAGWWNARSVGRKGCGGCVYGMIASRSSKRLGTRWRQVLFVFVFCIMTLLPLYSVLSVPVMPRRCICRLGKCAIPN